MRTHTHTHARAVMDLDFAGLDAAEVILALWKNTTCNTPMLAYVNWLESPKTVDDVRLDLQQRRAAAALGGGGGDHPVVWYDYLWGKPLKFGVDAERHTLHRVDLYNRDIGRHGLTAQEVLQNLRRCASDQQS